MQINVIGKWDVKNGLKYVNNALSIIMNWFRLNVFVNIVIMHLQK